MRNAQDYFAETIYIIPSEVKISTFGRKKEWNFRESGRKNMRDAKVQVDFLYIFTMRILIYAFSGE